MPCSGAPPATTRFEAGSIGDQIVDLALAAQSGALAPDAQPLAGACGDASLNRFMAMGQGAWSAQRLALSRGWPDA